MNLTEYFSSLNPLNLLFALPGNVAQGLIWGIMALGVFISFRLLDFPDLTVDGTFAAGGAVTVVLILGGMPAYLAILVAVIVGLLGGMVTGLLHTLLGIPGILAGILTQISFWSINLLILSGANRAVNVDKFNLLISLRHVSSAILTMMVFAGIIVAFLYWYFGTEQGSAIRATGNNPQMVKAQGVDIDFMKVLALSISNAMVAFSGGLMAQFQGFADIKMGQGAIVIGLASVIIGEVIGEAITGKYSTFYFKLGFVVVGGVIYYLVVGLVMWLKMPTDLLKLFTAAIVAVFLAVPYLKGKQKNAFLFTRKKGGIKSA